MRKILLFLPLILWGCVVEVESVSRHSEAAGEVEVVLDFKGCIRTRSSLVLDEYSVNDVNILLYRNGVIHLHEYLPEPGSQFRLSLVEGQVYDIYVLANAGQIPAEMRETDFRDRCAYEVQDMAELDGVVPMVWDSLGIKVEHGMSPVEVKLDRMVAKVTFSVDSDLLEGLLVTSVRMCQCASVVRPFKDYGGMGSRAEDVSEMIYGDYATTADLSILNDGGSMMFYVLENCQGVLLPDNKNPSGKLPDSLGEKAGLCTFLEVACIFDGEGFLEGEVTYRFYLGLDSSSSFDVPGNSCLDVTLQLTDTGLREVSWRVDADVSVREGYAWGRVEKGMHDLDELYVGEKLLYRLEISDEILSYVGGDASACTLEFSEGSAMAFSDLQGSGNVYAAEISCLASGRGELYLCGPEGQKLATLCDEVTITPPVLLFSEFSSTADDEPVEPLTYIPDCVINGADAEVYIYLVDKQYMNLNAKSAYGYDFSLFDLSLQTVV